MNRETLGEPITKEDAQNLSNIGERIFALACIDTNCTVYSQIPIGRSVIDFYVINNRDNGNIDKGKLVEVTLTERENLDKNREKPKKGKKINPETLQKTKKRKQIENMEKSGEDWTIMCRTELDNIKRNYKKKHPDFEDKDYDNWFRSTN